MSELSVQIRRAEPSDAEAIYDVYRNPRAVWGTFQIPFPSLEEWKKRLSQPPDGAYFLVAICEEKVIGMLGLHTAPTQPRRRHAAALGMAVHDGWHGRGVGNALVRAAVDLADNWLNLHRLELEVYTDNEPAVRLYQRNGFVVEGTLKDFAFRNGGYADAFTMARLRPPAAAKVPVANAAACG
jgi:putative acetyltransferase